MYELKTTHDARVFEKSAFFGELAYGLELEPVPALEPERDIVGASGVPSGDSSSSARAIALFSQDG